MKIRKIIITNSKILININNKTAIFNNQIIKIAKTINNNFIMIKYNKKNK